MYIVRNWSKDQSLR